MTEANLRSDARDCLVAVVTRDADLRRFREEMWYRIPDRVLGRALATDALDKINSLALYQTSAITDGLPGTIELWGEIEEITRATRREIIPDEPGHPSADESYHLLRVRSVERLDRPITSRRPRRVSFIRTTRDRLLHASDLNDLIIGSAAEERLWQALRLYDAERKYILWTDGTVMEVDFAIFGGEQAVGVLCQEEESEREEYGRDGWRILRFSPGRIEHDPADCTREIMEMLGELGKRG